VFFVIRMNLRNQGAWFSNWPDDRFDIHLLAERFRPICQAIVTGTAV
jgi:hypothetical protein